MPHPFKPASPEELAARGVGAPAPEPVQPASLTPPAPAAKKVAAKKTAAKKE